MKITHVNHHYLPMVGGLEFYTHRLCLSLEESGHESTVVTTDESLRGATAPADIENVVYCKTNASVLRNPFSLELFRHLREGDADVYHLHSPWTLSSLEAVFALPDDVPVVVTIHGFQPFTGRVAKLISRAYEPFAQRVFDRADAIIVLGEDDARRLNTEYDVPTSKIAVVPNGIDLDSMAVPPADVDAFRERYDLDPAVPTVLFVGRLVPEKNPELLLEAVVSELKDVDCQVVVVGGGEAKYTAALADIADDRIQFTGVLPHAETLAAYQAADLFVLLSVSEGLPTVVLEAMYAELPIVATPVGALPDFISDDNGAVVPLDATPADLASLLRPFLTDASLRETVGARNYALVVERFDWNRIAATIEALYADLVARRSDSDVSDVNDLRTEMDGSSPLASETQSL